MENNYINKDLNESKKICKNCNIEKSINDYSHYTGKLCKDCYKQKTLERVRKSRAKNKPEKAVSDKKVCKQCSIEKHLEDFKLNRKICKQCYNVNRVVKYVNNKNNKVKNNKIEENKPTKKVCKKCNIEKEISDFHKKQGKCKICFNEYMRIYYKENNIYEDIKINKKEYYNFNKEKINQRRKIIRYNNIEQVRHYHRNYWTEKCKNDVIFKLAKNARETIRQAFIRGGYKKDSKTENIIGCSFEYLLEHIQKQFQPWMTWDNQGKYNGEFNFGWDIDHIEPLFPEGIKRSPEDIIRLNHYTNLQPLCSKINRDIKRNRLDF
jgi:hypothetical protein